MARFGALHVCSSPVVCGGMKQREELLRELLRLKEEGISLRCQYVDVLKRFMRIRNKLRELQSDGVSVTES
jgi:disulfide oxidoreductase YuzD